MAEMATAAIEAAAGESRREHLQRKRDAVAAAEAAAAAAANPPPDPSSSSAGAPAAEPAEAPKPEAAAGEGWTATAWLTTQGLADIVASVLMQPLEDLKGEPAFDGASPYPGTVELSYFRALGRDQERGKEALGALLRGGDITQLLVDTLWPKLLSLANLGAATAGELHQKFVDEAQGFDLEYAGLKSFFGGLEAVVGAPSPKVLEGMKADHCTSADSIFPFDTPNYKMTTTSRIEWWFVA